MNFGFFTVKAVATVTAFLFALSAFFFQYSFASLAAESMPLQISEIRFYDYKRDEVDYHVGKQPLLTIPAGSEIAINGLVVNQNHEGEHFDYITQIIGSNGHTEYLQLRQGVAVPLGGQIGIDSETMPVVLDRAGNYTVEVFTWSNAQETPAALSDGFSTSMVTK